jgi:hypothetical protein
VDPLTASHIMFILRPLLFIGAMLYVRWLVAEALVQWATGQLLEGKMPRATVNLTPEKKELTTVEGGYVMLRRLPYGAKLRKDAEAMKMKFGMDSASKGDMDAEVAMLNVDVQLQEFKLCVVDHNLTKPNPDPKLAEDETHDVPLSFGDRRDVESLDPRVGDEISTMIGEMNDFVKQATTETRNSEGKS